MFSYEGAGPKKVDPSAASGRFSFSACFEGRNALTVNAENTEELVPTGLRLGIFVAGAFPSGGELLGVGSDFVPRRRFAHDVTILSTRTSLSIMRYHQLLSTKLFFNTVESARGIIGSRTEVSLEKHFD